MPVNTFGSNIKVETNVGGEMLDNDEYISKKNNWEHHHHPTEPWQQGTAEIQDGLLQDILLPKSEPIELDPALTTANRNDLKIKGFHQ